MPCSNLPHGIHFAPTTVFMAVFAHINVFTSETAHF